MTTNTFTDRANKVHNSKYNYDKSIYVNYDSKIIITCKKHGDFTQRAGSHLKGNGCAKCKYEKPNKLKYSVDIFVELAKEKHGDLYDYKQIKYINNKTNILIKCNSCLNIFSIKPYSHLQGHGCKSCKINLFWTKYKEKRSYILLEKLKNKFNNKFDYSKVEANSLKSKILLICHQHGEFQKSVENLLDKRCKICCPGCLKNFRSNISKKSRYTRHFHQSINNNGSFYLIKLSNDLENFYKIGITTRGIKNRFQLSNNKKYSGYEVEIISNINCGLEKALEIEEYCIRNNKNISYLPMKKISGYSECFSSIPIYEGILVNEINCILPQDHNSISCFPSGD